MEENITDKLSFVEKELKDKKELKDLQDILVKHISDSPKTEDDLLKLVPNAKYDQILKILKSLLSLKLINKEGFPVKYSLSKEIKDKLDERKVISENDKNQLRAAILIESKSNDKGKLRSAMEEISNTLKNDKNYLVYDLEVAEIILHDDLFSTYISAEVSCATLHDLFRLIFFYGATSVEILRPNKTQVSISDLQQTSSLLVDMIHGYVDMIYQLKKENAELSKLRR